MVPEKHLAVSNMPIEREKKLGNGWKEVQFKRTPPMASYLVVLVSGELEELKGGGGRRACRSGSSRRRQTGAGALCAGGDTKKVLAYYNDYFGIRYPMPKLDLIAATGRF